jgi:hypothetical protein
MRVTEDACQILTADASRVSRPTNRLPIVTRVSSSPTRPQAQIKENVTELFSVKSHFVHVKQCLASSRGTI